jgi:hypothetical protein
VSELHLFEPLRLLFERKQIPQIVVNVRIRRKAMEPLGAARLPWAQTLAIFGYAMVSCLVVNDGVKVAMIKWRVPSAIA